MNKNKERYKKVIVDFIADCCAELEHKICSSQGALPENILNEKYSALKYIKNLIKNIMSEDEEEILYILKEARERFFEEYQGGNNYVG